MPFEPVELALRDILRYLELAARFTAGMDLSTFRDDERTLLAVTRCLEIISEASRRLPPELKARHAAIDWRHMAAAGNVYRHDYDDVEAQFILETVRLALPPLRAAVEAELARLT
jgi:uncharacterized protein with HEPN domain